MVHLFKNYWFVLTQFSNFKGRASRAEYWSFILVHVVISVVFSVINAALFSSISVLDSIYSLVTLLPAIAVSVRRLHDTSRQGWWLLVPIVPLVFMCMPGTAEKNIFGDVAA